MPLVVSDIIYCTTCTTCIVLYWYADNSMFYILYIMETMQTINAKNIHIAISIFKSQTLEFNALCQLHLHMSYTLTFCLPG